MDIFGHCGQSSLTEIAFGEHGISNLYRLSTRLRGIDTPYALESKLRIAAMTSLAVAHTHSVALDDDDAERLGQYPRATIAHNDINPRNVIITQSGVPKLNDFNVAEFLTWTRTRRECGFESRRHEPWW